MNVMRHPEFLDAYPAFQTLWRHWNCWRGDEALPARASLRLADLEELSLNVHLVEWLGLGELRFRFVGLEAVMRAREETLGHNHFDHINRALVRPYAEAFEACRLQNCVTVGNFESDDDGEPRRMDLMILPLVNDRKEPRLGLVVIELEHALLGSWSSIELLQNVKRIIVTPIDTGFGIPFEKQVVTAA